MTSADTSLAELAHTSKAWPFEEARKLIKRLEKADPTGEVIFETGYGPSGLPHIGTFGEVARTRMVRHAFEVLKPGARRGSSASPTTWTACARCRPTCRTRRCWQRARQAADGACPIRSARIRASPRTTTRGCAPSSTASASSTSSCRRPSATSSGQFDATLLRMLEVYDKVMAIILPTLGPERRATYSPFLPVSPTPARCCRCR